MSNPSSLHKEKNSKKQEKIPVKAEKQKKRSRRALRTLLILGAVLIALVLLLWGAYHLILDYYLDKLNVVTKETGLIYQTEQLDDDSVVTEEIYHNGELDGNNLPLICDTKDVTNILLLAVDSRGNEAGLSDVMILLSINQKTGKIVLCSFLRDILARFPEIPENPLAGKYSKLTHAHSYGGPELTMAVLKETFNIEVKYYAKVNFSSFVSMVDAMGGVDMYLTSSEIWWINEVVHSDEIAELFPSYKKTDISGGEGTYCINGLQALSHARNRFIGSDWARTQRQRDMIQAMATKAKSLSLSQLNNLLNTVLPLITTNMSKDMIKDMIGNVPSYLTYEIESTRVPGEGLYREENYDIIPDLEKNCTALYESIYGEATPTKGEDKK